MLSSAAAAPAWLLVWPVAPEPARDAPADSRPVAEGCRCAASRGTWRPATARSARAKQRRAGFAAGARCLPCRYRRLHEHSRAEQGGSQIGWRWTRRNPDRSATMLTASHASADASTVSLGSARLGAGTIREQCGSTDLQRGSVGIDRRLVIASLVEVVPAVLQTRPT